MNDGGQGAAQAGSPHAYNFFEQVHIPQRTRGGLACQLGEDADTMYFVELQGLVASSFGVGGVL